MTQCYIARIFASYYLTIKIITIMAFTKDSSVYISWCENFHFEPLDENGEPNYLDECQNALYGAFNNKKHFSCEFVKATFDLSTTPMIVLDNVDYEDVWGDLRYDYFEILDGGKSYIFTNN